MKVVSAQVILLLVAIIGAGIAFSLALPLTKSPCFADKNKLVCVLESVTTIQKFLGNQPKPPKPRKNESSSKVTPKVTSGASTIFPESDPKSISKVTFSVKESFFGSLFGKW